DFRRYPQIPLVRRVYHDPRPGIDQHVGHDLPAFGVDEMGHAGLFGSDHDGAPVPADGETFRLDPDLDLRDPLARGVVDHRDQGIVLVRDIDPVAGDRHRQRFGIRTGVDPAYDLACPDVDDIDVARVAVADQDGLVVQGVYDSPGPLVGRNRRDDFVAVTVEHGHRIIDFVRDEELAGVTHAGRAQEEGDDEQRRAAAGHGAKRHCVSG